MQTRTLPNRVNVYAMLMWALSVWSSHPSITDANSNHLEFTFDTHGCQLKPLGVHIRHPRMLSRTAWSSHSTPMDAESNRLKFTFDAHGCQLKSLGVHIRHSKTRTKTTLSAFSTNSTAIHGRMSHVSLDHDGAVMVFIAEAAKEKYDE